MAQDKLANLSVPLQGEYNEEPTPESAEEQAEATAIPGREQEGDQPTTPLPPPWFEFIRTASDTSISQRFAKEAGQIITGKSELSKYCPLALLDSETYIGTWDLDRLFRALQSLNPEKDKDVLLFLLSRGGNIEPAYQISKICKSFTKNRFVVAVPRFAKSAATLIATGAHEIHMGPLGHLGPIDPQLGGLPALSVSQALQSIAALSERYPRSADMFAKYLNYALTVEQIGYCERISESAVQYAERLLSNKPNLPKPANDIAKDLVHTYKDHGFVIDFEEAKDHLGDDWIRTGTPELAVAEQLYSLFDEVNIFLDIFHSKRVLVVGEFSAEDVFVFKKPKR